jgi:hypothetical protein
MIGSLCEYRSSREEQHVGMAICSCAFWLNHADLAVKSTESARAFGRRA